MNSDKFINLCKDKIVDIFNSTVDKSSDVSVSILNDDVYEVWYSEGECENNALLSTTIPDGMYYESNYNNWINLLTIDSYKKYYNKCINDVKVYGTNQFIDVCKDEIKEYIKEKYEVEINEDIIECIWHSKVLHHHKAVFKLCRSIDNDNIIFEITFNGISEDIYFDMYKKFDTNNYTV